MEEKQIATQEKQFAEVVDMIVQHRSHASQVVNEDTLLTAWHVGGYVSRKLKSEEWGSKVVTQLSEYIRSQRPDIKGFSRSSIYNMVMFFEEYSSAAFSKTIEKYLNSEFVQMPSAQFVQPVAGQMPMVLTLTTLTNHFEILCRCKTNEERLFYILYANKERLAKREMQRCISNDTYSSLLSSKNSMSKGLLGQYPNAPVMFKDTVFLDFLGLPKKHSESKLKKGLIEHMKQFILD